MAVDLTRLVGQQVQILTGAGLNLTSAIAGVDNITVDAVDSATNTIAGHYGNRSFVVAVPGNAAVYAVGASANAPLFP